jgi:hypothetical protein
MYFLENNIHFFRKQEKTQAESAPQPNLRSSRIRAPAESAPQPNPRSGERLVSKGPR